ncbi:MAG: DUF2089 domain-containing protein [Candidatus Omnitrophica bacterium]|nr:DUF2089 domain-containing protein [Candidatus Omnitrophota bacterium]MCK5393486.1 DUF2089 domain-containing protein [Candidatus Omnitrophota bacterium]MCK5492028.1 DUF2089 domain-containing protein [Candidatus Omnitrophota bacterium]
MRIHECPFCNEKVRIKKVECCKCGINFEGEFYTSPVMSLSEEDQSFIELFVLNSGSLKEMAKLLGITYPTVRSKLDQIISNMKEEINRHDEYKAEILEKVSQGKITADKAAEIIKNL